MSFNISFNDALCSDTDTKLPVGIQLLAPTFGETRLLQIAHQFESRCDAWQQRPNLGLS